jgi:hypothetical protein
LVDALTKANAGSALALEDLHYVYVLVAMPKARMDNFISSPSSEEKKRVRTS